MNTRKVLLQTTVVDATKVGVFGPWLSRDGKRVAVVWTDSSNLVGNACRTIDVGTGKVLFEQTGLPVSQTINSERDELRVQPGRALAGDLSYRDARGVGLVDLGKEQARNVPNRRGRPTW